MACTPDDYAVQWGLLGSGPTFKACFIFVLSRLIIRLGSKSDLLSRSLAFSWLAIELDKNAA
jgi:hypothetical protein